MNIKTEIHTNDYMRDEDTATGESSMNANIYVEFQGVMPSEKEKIRMVLDTFYKDLRAALKNIG